ncbi:hypothetical protein RZS28_01995 [Methylocapsa polymorpha]|uniref:Antitoxin SocA-like Panacea domain-containing protein n=1 Tax=Methylocapsa polymorpha TaxID=3080828 RepID=A0ABZ0HT44_9HYPH|nr:hypothetical protein RZS28_01995 [Methylocapsa sp. RX1]
MTAEEIIVAILRTLPAHTVRGKKRLQKLVYFLQQAGVDCAATFQIRNFGPFSTEVELASTMLTLFGDIEEKEIETGYAKYLTIEYSLSEEAFEGDPLSAPFSEMLLSLNEFSTIDLEVASTVLFFEKSGCDRTSAISRTRAIKPTKVNDKTLANANAILRLFGS